MNTTGGTETIEAPSWLRRSGTPLLWLLKLSPDEATFQTRKFNDAEPSRQHTLELAGKTFIGGYNAALAASGANEVLQHVHGVGPDLRGFAVEGAATGCAIADILPFRSFSLAQHLRIFDRNFSYLGHVGAGWALARVPWRRARILALLDPVHHWLAYDGLGFHDAFFYHRNVLAGWRRRMAAYASRAYDQGVGRALWFVAGGSVAGATRLIAGFPEARHNDLWSGLGLAMTYAGPVGEDDLSLARKNSGGHRFHFCQGAAFASEAHARARHIPAHTDLAARTLAGTGAVELAALVCEARDNLPHDTDRSPAYEIWRVRVANAISAMQEQRR